MERQRGNGFEGEGGSPTQVPGRDSSHIYADGSSAQQRREIRSHGSGVVDFDFKSASDQAQLQLRRAVEKVTQYTRESPERALISAILAGYVAGKLARLAFRGNRRMRRYRQYRALAREFR